MSPDLLSRQQFIRQGVGQLLSQLSTILPHEPAENPSNHSLQPRPNALRPPGALAKAAFVETCDPTCQACGSACPRQAIQFDNKGFPFIQPEDAPCVMCVDVACTKVCPTGALEQLSFPTEIAMGTAVIELTVCTAFQGSACQVCVTSCPLPEIAIQLNEGLPEVLPTGCTGCGICVYDCPTPGAITITPKTATMLS